MPRFHRVSAWVRLTRCLGCALLPQSGLVELLDIHWKSGACDTRTKPARKLLGGDLELSRQCDHRIGPTIGGPLETKYDVICFSHLRWSFVFQRPQHLLSRCARDRRVYFVEE